MIEITKTVLLEWILEKSVYNVRVKYVSDFYLAPEIIGAKFLFLYNGRIGSSKLFYRINDNGPQLISVKDKLFETYPDATQDNYLCFSFENVKAVGFSRENWDFNDLKSFRNLKHNTMPVAVSLSELLSKNK